VEARTPALQEINRKLRPLPLVTCVADPACFDLKSLRRRFRPPPLFELYNVKDLSGVAYPIAFGLDALLLDSVLFWRKEYQS
jgi:CRISPR-associated endonuclease/helicase Cas3